MKIEFTVYERSFNRHTQQSNDLPIATGFGAVGASEYLALRKAAESYGLSLGEMVALLVHYYFGDGKNHFACEHCDYFDANCNFPKPGEQLTTPLT